MRYNVRAILLSFFTVSFFITTQAQSGGGRNFDPLQRAEMMTKMMADSLSLSTRQSEKVGEINLKYARQMQQTRDQNNDGDWEAMRSTMMTLRQEQNKELQGVLTTGQWQHWEKIQEAMWSGRERQRGGPGKERPTKKKEKRT